ncbi:MAG: hypothetical protein CL625_07360 [Arenimonas sp.]|nr:hypothetical protein [Arenimonas sp.]
MRTSAWLITGLVPLQCLLLACSSPADATADPLLVPPAVVPSLDGNAGTDDTDMLVGEWAVDPALCTESRITFTSDGRHEALMGEGGEWRVLASGEYEHSGDELRISFEGVVQHREILSVDADRLVLRHEDEALARASGSHEAMFHRCKPRDGAGTA